MQQRQTSVLGSLALIGASILGMSCLRACSESSPLKSIAEGEKEAISSAVFANPGNSLEQEVIVSGDITSISRTSEYYWNYYSAPRCLNQISWDSDHGGTVYTTNYKLTDSKTGSALSVIEQSYALFSEPTLYTSRIECVGTIKAKDNGQYYLLVDRVPIQQK